MVTIFETPNAQQAGMIASRLSRGQRAAVEGLDDEPCMLGCAEDTAIRLAQPATTRPALTLRHEAPANAEYQYPRFTLTPWGETVKASIASQTGGAVRCAS